tara:strand:- start:188 stop:529 length:342 start_codon:yes stop_codon:yes gene_type:complete
MSSSTNNVNASLAYTFEEQPYAAVAQRLAKLTIRQRLLHSRLQAKYIAYFEEVFKVDLYDPDQLDELVQKYGVESDFCKGFKHHFEIIDNSVGLYNFDYKHSIDTLAEGLKNK